MAGENQFYPVATGAGANVRGNAAWGASGLRQTGFQSGIAPSLDFNAAFRQGTVMASALGQVIADAGNAALDDGNLAGLVANLKATLASYVASGVPSAQRVHFGSDTGTANRIIANVSPDISGYDAGALYLIAAANAPTGPAVANLDGRGDRNIVRRDGTAIQAGDWKVGEIIELRDDGSRLQLANWTQAAAVGAAAFWHSGVASGSTNALSVTLAPAITAYEDRLPVFVVFPSGVANGATISLNGLSAIPLQRNDGSPIQAPDIPPGAFALFGMSGTAALRLIGLGRGEVQRIAINPTLYVRPNGNDANDGLSNTDGGAFRTIAAALARGTSQFNFASSALNIQLGVPGTYDSPFTLPRGTGTINILGDANNATSYVITGASQPGTGCIQTSGPLVLLGVSIQNTGAGSHGVATTGVGTAVLINTAVISNQTTTGSHLFAVDGSGITLGTGCLLQGNAAAAFSATGGRISVNPNTNVVIAGSPTFSNATAVAQDGGRVSLLAGASVSGAASGQRYRSDNYSIINTNGGGANAFPGSTPGTTSNGLYL
ncbi:hypothetical protein [Methylorubrum populi]|uniref:Uncharacterized protein n=1 Tax=Methylorubrum populi TaxID=223967 RepID=A0A833N4C4_9HYPH|nr:hypothetical protein [Methylorubrum populi]KAB7788054.1 hypothetical protein F8B43_0059 [Methylorubrum populi]